MRANEVRRGGFLWRIDLEPPSYLFGTMHIGHPSKLWPLILSEAETAFERSDSIVLEMDFRDESYYERFANCLNIPKSAKNAFPPNLDLFLGEKGRNSGKNVLPVETPEEHCEAVKLLFSLNIPDGIPFVPSKVTAELQRILPRRYVNGNRTFFEETYPGLKSEADRDDRNNNPRLKERLREFSRNVALMQAKRNRLWSSRMIKLLRNEGHRKSYFFAFGTLHFFGSENVVDSLRKEGFKIDAVRPSSKFEENDNSITASSAHNIKYDTSSCIMTLLPITLRVNII